MAIYICENNTWHNMENQNVAKDGDFKTISASSRLWYNGKAYYFGTPTDITMFKVVITEPGQTVSFYNTMPMYSSQAFIDWGDCSAVDCSSMSGFYDNILHTHEYTTAGEYTIGVRALTQLKNVSGAVTELINIEEGMTSIAFSFYKTEYSTNSLISLPAIFPNSLEDCDSAFTNNRLLENKPDTLILPSGVTNARYMFYGNTAMTWDISDFFPDFSGDNINLEWMFGGDVNITGVAPADKLWNSGKTFNSTGCFYGCVGLSNYDEIPDTWK